MQISTKTEKIELIMVGDLIQLVTQWWVWIPLAGTLGYFAWQNRRRAYSVVNTDHALLLVEIPRANDKKELAAEQMFASLHGILRPKSELVREGLLQEHISFEIASIGKRIRFYIWTPKHLQNFVEGQVYAQYPTAQIHELREDYSDSPIGQRVVHSAELVLTDNEVLPIKTFQSFEVDPLAAITATLAKLEEEGEELWIQVLARPIDDSWHKRGSKAVERIKRGGGILTGDGFTTLFHYLGELFNALWKPPEPGGETKAHEVSERDKSRITGIEEKTKKLGFQVKVRLVYIGNDKTTARLRMQAMVGTFKQFNTTNLNGFHISKQRFDSESIAEYRARFFLDQGYILNIEEIASLYHLPHTSVETPSIVWATSKTAEPPPSLPVVGRQPDNEISAFGLTNFRGSNMQFGIRRSDRGRHLYIVGQTGTGKSGLLQLLTLSDVFHNVGFGIIDPHGDYAADVLRFIPQHRLKDVIYFNPADREWPVGFNPLEVTDPNLKNHISSELVGVMKRMFESWGPRLEYILRYTLLALLDYPNATMLDITRMLTEKKFREDVILMIQDPVVRNFWINEFGSWNEKFATEAVAPVLNKVGAFTANPMIRNIIGQPKSTFNIRKALDEGQILIVNLSRGLVGEDNAAILGAMMVTKIQLAAMSRADIPRIEDRRPFYLYVDEFQNFATDSFAVILSEARKYGLNLTVANQYIAQMTPTVKDAVFGNVGSLVSFRVGPDDAHALQRNFEPQFEAMDLIQLHNRYFVAAMTIGGEKTPAFSATTLLLPQPTQDLSREIIDYSRSLYGRKRLDIEAMIIESSGDAFTPQAVKERRGGQKGPKYGATTTKNNEPPAALKPRPTVLPPERTIKATDNKKHFSNTNKKSENQVNRKSVQTGSFQEDTIINLR